MSVQPKPRYSPHEYLARERSSSHKSEYFAGEVFAMAGASKRHNLIVTNLVGELRQQLKGRPCDVYPSDMRVKISRTGLYTYPDVTVVCGDAEFEDDQQDTLLNPTVLIEVLSKSTEAYDRGTKFEHYRKLESLQEYVLVAQSKPHVEHFVRQPDNHWLLSETNDLQAAFDLPSIGCRLAMAEVYDKVQLDAESDELRAEISEFGEVQDDN
jgi:Uma2 family endonuclease